MDGAGRTPSAGTGGRIGQSRQRTNHSGSVPIPLCNLPWHHRRWPRTHRGRIESLSSRLPARAVQIQAHRDHVATHRRRSAGDYRSRRSGNPHALVQSAQRPRTDRAGAVRTLPEHSRPVRAGSDQRSDDGAGSRRASTESRAQADQSHTLCRSGSLDRRDPAESGRALDCQSEHRRLGAAPTR